MVFTGIIETTGTIAHVKKSADVWDVAIRVDESFLSDVKLGDSIAVNGVCLTVVSFQKDTFTVQAVAETRKSVSVNMFKLRSCVNLEKALPALGRLDGHIVQGHVDGVACVKKIDQQRNACLFTFSADKTLVAQLVPKGSIAIDGISLTIQHVDVSSFSVAVIPHTYAETTLAVKRLQEEVNVETDIVGKYIFSYLSRMPGAGTNPSITLDALRVQGF